MDRVLPSMRYRCRSGLPGLPRAIEEALKDLSDLSPNMLTESELEQLDTWLEARVEPIRLAKIASGDSHQETRRLLGWAGRGSKA